MYAYSEGDGFVPSEKTTVTSGSHIGKRKENDAGCGLDVGENETRL